MQSFLIEKPLKTKTKSKEIESCRFLVKMLMSAKLKRWFIHFFDLLQTKYKCAKFHYCRICLTGFRLGGLFPYLWGAPKTLILNRLKTAAFLDNNWRSFCSSLLIPFPAKVCSCVPLSSMGEYLENYRGWLKVYHELI